MTLSTTILILDPTPPEPLFRFGRTLLGATDAVEWTHEPAPHPLFGTVYPAEMSNCLGQGLAAIWKVQYATDGPLIDPYPDEREEGIPDHALKVWMDTAFGYHGPNGSRCSDLHAWMVMEVGLWCEERNLRYLWNLDTHIEWYDSVLDIHTAGDPERGRLRPTPIELGPLPPPVPTRRQREAAIA